MITAAFPRAFDNAPQGYMPTTPAAVQAAKQNQANSATIHDVMLRRSPDSAAMLEYWDLTDTIVDGINALRLAGERYLPRFTDEGDTDFQYRLKCTKLTNIYRDTVEGLSSKPFEQEVALVADENKSVPESIEAFVENVDGSGNNLTIFSGATFFNGINSAIHWIFVDHPPANPNVRTQADAKRAGIRPYWSHVLGRNVLDPRSSVINGVETLTYIRIFEPGAPDHVRIFERMENGSIRWELRDKRTEWIDVDGGKTQFHVLDEGVLTIDVIPLVPFITARRDGRTWKLFPAMRDAADLQIELYQQESGLKFAKQLTAYPMLAGNGISPMMEADGKTPKKLAVGPGRVLYAPASTATGAIGSWAYVEPSAQSLKFLADDIKDTMSQLRELGRQPLTAQSGNLTVITTAVAAGKAKSAVKAWAFTLKDALENAMVITCKFMGVAPAEYDPTVSVFVEFDEFMEGKDLDTLDSARDRKDISQLTYWEELKRRAVLSPEFNAETEEKRLMDELPGDGADNNTLDNPPPANDPTKPTVPTLPKPGPADPDA